MLAAWPYHSTAEGTMEGVSRAQTLPGGGVGDGEGSGVPDTGNGIGCFGIARSLLEGTTSVTWAGDRDRQMKDLHIGQRRALPVACPWRRR